MELVDQKLGSEFNKKEAIRMIKVALLCTNPSPALRPTMSEVVSMLEGRTAVHESVIDPKFHGDPSRFNALTAYIDHISHHSSSDPQSFFHSSDATRMDSTSTSNHSLLSSPCTLR